MVGRMCDQALMSARCINSFNDCVVYDPDNWNLNNTANPYYGWLANSINGTPLFNGFAYSGAIFDGLNTANGSLTVTSRIFYEVFPQSSILSPYLTIATPSPPFDANAFMLYAQALDLLPVGVPVGENNAGDWFRRVGKALGSAARFLAPAVGLYNPTAGGALRMLGDIGRQSTTVNASVRQVPFLGVPKKQRRRIAQGNRVRRVRVSRRRPALLV
jgi:hypothetical protein